MSIFEFEAVSALYLLLVPIDIIFRVNAIVIIITKYVDRAFLFDIRRATINIIINNIAVGSLAEPI